MATHNNILDLTGKNVKYIVTKSKSTLDLLQKSEGGPLIIYEPYNDSDYRELYAKDYFVAAGYGATSIEEQNKLTNIAGQYDIDIENLSSGISGVEQNIHNLEDEKLNRGEDLKDSPLTIQGATGLVQIEHLGDLIENINGIKYSKLLEIISVEYTIKYRHTNISDIQTCTNKDKLPIGSIITEIQFKITADKNDSAGVKDINISLYDQIYNDSTQKYENHIYDISAKNINLVKKSNISQKTDEETNITTISFTQTYKPNPADEKNIPYYIVKPGENIFFENISIITLDKTQDIKKLPLYLSTVDNIEITNNNDLVLYGTDFIYYTTQTNTTEDKYKISMIDNYGINTYKTEFELLDENIQYLEIKSKIGNIIDLSLLDFETNNIYKLNDYLSLKPYDDPQNNEGYNIYKFNLTDGNNSGNLRFLMKDNNGITYLHKGIIQIIFSNVQTNKIYNSGNNMNWISFEGGTSIRDLDDLDGFLTNGYL